MKKYEIKMSTNFYKKKCEVVSLCHLYVLNCTYVMDDPYSITTGIALLGICSKMFLADFFRDVSSSVDIPFCALKI